MPDSVSHSGLDRKKRGATPRGSGPASQRESTAGPPGEPASTKEKARTSYRFSLTRLGYHFLFVGLFAMVGGSIRGFNLLLLLAGLLTSVILIQWRIGRGTIRAAMARRRLPNEVFAGNVFDVRYEISNLSRFIPIWMLHLNDQIRGSEHSQGDAPARKTTLTAQVSAAAGCVPRRSQTPTRAQCLITERGRFRFGPITLSTVYPFSLLESKKHLRGTDHQASICVFPQLIHVPPSLEKRLPIKLAGNHRSPARSHAGNGDFFGLREWQYGDSSRQIHWRTSARLNAPVVCQYEQMQRSRVVILLDGTEPKSDERKSTSRNQSFEVAVSLATTLMLRIGSMDENRVTLATATDSPLVQTFDPFGTARRLCLTALAEIQSHSLDQQPRFLEQSLAEIRRSAGSNDHLIVVSTRSLSSSLSNTAVPHEIRTLRKALSVWQRRGRLTWVDVNDALLLDETDARRAASLIASANFSTTSRTNTIRERANP